MKAKFNKPNVCGNCGSDDISYSSAELTSDRTIQYPYGCNNCGAGGIEHADIKFHHNEVTITKET